MLIHFKKRQKYMFNWVYSHWLVKICSSTSFYANLCFCDVQFIHLHARKSRYTLNNCSFCPCVCIDQKKLNEYTDWGNCQNCSVVVNRWITTGKCVTYFAQNEWPMFICIVFYRDSAHFEKPKCPKRKYCCVFLSKALSDNCR